MPKNYQDWPAFERQKNIPPVIAIGGDEKLAMKQAQSYIRKQCLASDVANLNHDRLDLSQKVIEDLLSAANTLPMMAQSRLVEVEKADKLDDAALKQLEAYLRRPCPSTHILFIFESVNLQKKIFKLLDKLSLLFKFASPKVYEMPAFVQSFLRKNKLVLDSDATSLLTLMVGTDLLLLEQCKKKLDLLGKEIITVGDIQDNLADSFEQDAFIFGKSFVLGRLKMALQSLYRMQRAQTQPILVIGMLAWQIRQLLKAKDLFSAMSDYEVKKKVAFFGPDGDALLKMSKKLSRKKLMQQLSELCDIDYKLKSSAAPAWLCLEEWVMRQVVLVPRTR